MCRAKAICKRYTEEEILLAAELILGKRVRETPAFLSPNDTTKYLRVKLGTAEREHFGVIFLDAQNKVIEDEIMFSGTLTSASVYPREIVKRGLQLNAAGIILYHNHPSGTVDPSDADRHLTKMINDICHQVDIKVLDHIIVCSNSCLSFATYGYL